LLYKNSFWTQGSYWEVKCLVFVALTIMLFIILIAASIGTDV